MESRLEVVAKAVARGATRRQALRLAGGGVAGGVLAVLGVGKASAGLQTEPIRPECRQCINQFQGSCVALCARISAEPDEPESCALACVEGNRLTCTILGYCDAEDL